MVTRSRRSLEHAHARRLERHERLDPGAQPQRLGSGTRQLGDERRPRGQRDPHPIAVRRLREHFDDRPTQDVLRAQYDLHAEGIARRVREFVRERVERPRLATIR